MKQSMKTLSGILALTLTVLVTSSCRKAEEPVEAVRPVKTITLDESGGAGVRAFPGVVQAAQRAKLSFRVSGPLVQLPIYEGQQVKAGQLLAQIDPRDYQTAVRNTEARLADLNAQYKAMQSARPEDIRRLEAGVAAAQSKLLEATASFRRYQRLYENNNVSKAEYDQARAARDVAEAEVQSAEESLQVARSGARPEDMEAMEARMRALQSDLGNAKDRLEDTSLRAPYDGIIAERYVQNYEFVSAFNNILSLQDITTVEIVAQVPENILAGAKQGSRATFRASFPSSPGLELDAVPTEFEVEADPVTRTYNVTFQCPQPETANVFAGMTAEIQVTGVGIELPGWLVPISAIFGDSTGSNVWVLDEGARTARKVTVELGEPSGDGIWVISGLESGMKVITAGAQFLSEDQLVRVITDELRDRQ
jgi:multidrug efflux pump subunit AcrA (membrane-fusion protein)